MELCILFKLAVVGHLQFIDTLKSVFIIFVRVFCGELGRLFHLFAAIRRQCFGDICRKSGADS